VHVELLSNNQNNIKQLNLLLFLFGQAAHAQIISRYISKHGVLLASP